MRYRIAVPDAVANATSCADTMKLGAAVPVDPCATSVIGVQATPSLALYSAVRSVFIAAIPPAPAMPFV